MKAPSDFPDRLLGNSDQISNRTRAHPGSGQQNCVGFLSHRCEVLVRKCGQFLQSRELTGAQLKPFCRSSAFLHAKILQAFAEKLRPQLSNGAIAKPDLSSHFYIRLAIGASQYCRAPSPYRRRNVGICRRTPKFGAFKRRKNNSRC
ncbi:MAG TPA: hypothetical protein VFA15_01760 [Nitrososphaera sp.]|nr:hypothetical protein [Nitrososphaera sp.]